MADDKVILLFLRPYRQYIAGDVAGFPPDAADKILRTRVEGFQTIPGGEQEKVKQEIAVRYDPTRSGSVRAVVPPSPQQMRDEPLIAVQFTRNAGPYRANDVAGFPADQARRLVEGYQARDGYRPSCAVYYEPDAGTEAADDLEAMDYRELQEVAKGLDVKASGKEEDIRERIREARVAAEDAG